MYFCILVIVLIKKFLVICVFNYLCLNLHMYSFIHVFT